MASIYKRSGKGAYIVSWHDHEGRRQTKSSRTTDRKVAERIAAKEEAQVALRREGVVDARQDRFAAANRRPLAEHIDEYVRMNKQNLFWFLRFGSVFKQLFSADHEKRDLSTLLTSNLK